MKIEITVAGSGHTDPKECIRNLYQIPMKNFSDSIKNYLKYSWSITQESIDSETLADALDTLDAYDSCQCLSDIVEYLDAELQNE